MKVAFSIVINIFSSLDNQIQLPFDKFLGSHLRFGFRHLSKFEGKTALFDNQLFMLACALYILLPL